jgi:hypothetical protein
MHRFLWYIYLIAPLLPGCFLLLRKLPVVIDSDLVLSENVLRDMGDERCAD